MPPTYHKPDVDAPITNLAPDDAQTDALTPSTIVRCINRGPSAIVTQFDGQHFTIPPGYFDTTHERAKHFAARLIVPGTRNPDPQSLLKVTSFIAILGIDRPEKCVPFTVEELAAMGERVEGLARDEMVSPDDRETTAVSMKSKAGTSAAARGSQKANDITPGDHATAEAKERARAALAPSKRSAVADDDAASRKGR